MKFLNDQRITREDGEIKLTLRPVTTSQQARLIELGSLPGATARIELTRWVLKNCVEKISANGQDIEPVMLADQADLSDPDTMIVMIKIGGMVCDVAFAKAEDVKKSRAQPPLGE